MHGVRVAPPNPGSSVLEVQSVFESSRGGRIGPTSIPPDDGVHLLLNTSLRFRVRGRCQNQSRNGSGGLDNEVARIVSELTWQRHHKSIMTHCVSSSAKETTCKISHLIDGQLMHVGSLEKRPAK